MGPAESFPTETQTNPTISPEDDAPASMTGRSAMVPPASTTQLPPAQPSSVPPSDQHLHSSNPHAITTTTTTTNVTSQTTATSSISAPLTDAHAHAELPQTSVNNGNVNDAHSNPIGDADAHQGDANDGSTREDQPAPAPSPPVPYWRLFRFTTTMEKAFMLFACLCAAVHGTLLPLFTVAFGSIINTFTGPQVTAKQLVGAVGSVTKWFLILALIAFIVSYFQVRLQIYVAQRSGLRIRKLYFQSLLRQDFQWYDAQSTGELTARVASDVDLIQAGIGDKLGSAIQYLTQFLIGFILAFVYSWKLTLVILAFLPLLIGAGAVVGKKTAGSAGKEQDAYGAAGAVASEVISLIRTVSAFGGQAEESRRYEMHVRQAYRSGVRRAFMSGFGIGVVNFIIFAAYALSFWFGAKLIRQHEISVTDLFVAFFSVLIGAMGVGQATPSFESFNVARGAAPRIFGIIDRVSTIDPLSQAGKVLDSVQGRISFHGVTFNYKSRELKGGQPVLNNLNLEIEPGTTHALVGHSGCGKSSTMGLMERFYDPILGSVLLDGVDIRELNVRWLRSQIGYVGQMPTLFRASIRDNIAFGAALDFLPSDMKGTGDLVRREVTDAEVIEAAKQANAHSFITKLPQGYHTMLGERGALLSGGQKQRICIARAIVRNPKILLLDEATSALDAQSERTVQDALEQASKGRTTVLIAHRLSTVRNAEAISMFKDGEIVESGRHDELMQRTNGAYRELVNLQEIHSTTNSSVPHATSSHSDQNAAERNPARSVETAPTISIQESQAEAANDNIKMDDSSLPPVDKGVAIRAFKSNMKEWPYILAGFIGAGLTGVSWPLRALIFSEVTSLLAKPNNEREVTIWSLMFLVLGGVALLGNFLMTGMLGVSGERLTLQMRMMSFNALLRQEMGFFDEVENSVGALSARLATEASHVKGITGESVGLAGLVIASVGAGLGIAFSGCWRVALIVLFMIPFLGAGGYVQTKKMSGFDSGMKKEFQKAGTVAGEAVDNVRTITGLGVQDIFISRYNQALDGPVSHGDKAANVSGLAFGFAESFLFILFATAFWTGSRFIQNGQCSFLGLMKAVTGLVFTAISLGTVAASAPNLGIASAAATNIFRLVDRTSAIDPTSSSGKRLEQVVGEVKVDKAVFEYPSRPDVAVLRGLSVGVAPGKTLALVGQSGCGKSTVISLLERFYDVRSGSLQVDGEELRSIHLPNARSHMALVQQEPDLFNRTVKENIAYGLSHEAGTPVTDEQIVQAAKSANAHAFIMSLPQGYDTPVGERGNALSGGQRQRVAIARSLVRQPRLLLLDEATSALDARSEKLVQDALDEARQGRTTIVIAHRLSSIKDADCIALVSKGKVLETGTHEALMAKRGLYAELVKNQISETPIVPTS